MDHEHSVRTTRPPICADRTCRSARPGRRTSAASVGDDGAGHVASTTSTKVARDRRSAHSCDCGAGPSSGRCIASRQYRSTCRISQRRAVQLQAVGIAGNREPLHPCSLMRPDRKGGGCLLDVSSWRTRPGPFEDARPVPVIDVTDLLDLGGRAVAARSRSLSIDRERAAVTPSRAGVGRWMCGVDRRLLRRVLPAAESPPAGRTVHRVCSGSCGVKAPGAF